MSNNFDNAIFQFYITALESLHTTIKLDKEFKEDMSDSTSASFKKLSMEFISEVNKYCYSTC
jgi:phytoene/squalene synthetase